MALELDISYCQSDGCKLLTITDESGLYDDPDNLTGWGAPNQTIAGVTSATLTITDPSDIEHDIDIIADNILANFTTCAYNELIFDIPNTSLGLASTDLFSDGRYIILYTIVGDVGTYTAERRIFMFCQMQKRIDELLVKFAQMQNCNKCDTKFMTELYQAFILFDALKSSVFCGAESTAISIYTRIEKMLKLIDYDYLQ